MLVFIFILIITSYVSTSLSQTFSKLNLWRARSKDVHDQHQQAPISAQQVPANLWTCLTQLRNSKNIDDIKPKSGAGATNGKEEFSLDAARDEDFESQLQDNQKQAVLDAVSKELVSPRSERIRNLYAMRSVLEWKSFIEGLPDEVCRLPSDTCQDGAYSFCSICHHLPNLLKITSGSTKILKLVTMQNTY